MSLSSQRFDTGVELVRAERAFLEAAGWVATVTPGGAKEWQSPHGNGVVLPQVLAVGMQRHIDSIWEV